MSGTFSSLNTSLSALRHHRVAMDVASGNVANAGTEGYARRQVIGQATGAPAVPAMWSRWGIAGGDGVQSGAVTRMVDPLLDARSRTEHGALSYSNARAASLVRFETTLGEPGPNGVAAALADFRQGWHDVANNPGDLAARSQLLARAETLAGAVRTQDRALTTEWADQRARLTALGEEVGQVSAELDRLNDGLRTAHVAGTDAGVLLDRRDQLALRLAELTGSTTSINPDTTVTVTVGGEKLVDPTPGATSPAVVTVTGALDLDDVPGPPPSPAQLQVNGQTVVPTAGTIGAVLTVMTTDLPTYRQQLDSFAAELRSAANAQHTSGVDLNGDQGLALFGGTGAQDLTVSLTDPRQVAAAAQQVDAAGNPVVDGAGKPVPVGALDNSNALALAGLDLGARSYRETVARFGVTVASANRAAENQAVIVDQVDGSREALSGISIDEEMVNLLAAQRAYEGAARVMTAVDSMLDTLINRTGLR